MVILHIYQSFWFQVKNRIKNDLLKNILKDCFWDYHFSADEIEEIVINGSSEEKYFLFHKILAHSRHLLLSMEVFSRKDLEAMLNKKIPEGTRSDYLQHRKELVEFFYFDKELNRRELAWL